jgi:glucan biosynthesis protein C
MAAPVSRLAWVDNLRTLIIVLVVNMHACVTYSHVGSWYVNEAPEPGMLVKIAFVFWQGHLQAFFMGLLFFLAGVFAHQSLERRGTRAFLRERAVRLGLPALLYMLVLHPFMVYVLLGYPRISNRPSLAVLYERYLASGGFLSGNGPLWFALALLVFCLVLAGWRGARPRPASTNSRPKPAPGPAALIGFGAVLVVTTFLIRLVQPIGTNVLNFQLCFFAQYIAAFAVGVAASRHGWLLALVESRPARMAGWLGLIGGPMVLALVAWLGGPPPEAGFNPYNGGWNAKAFGLVLWEQFAGLGLALGSLALFHRRFNVGGRGAAWLSQHSFAVYVLHPPLLVALTPLLRRLNADPFSRAALLTLLGVAAAFLAAAGAKRIPGLRAIL